MFNRDRVRACEVRDCLAVAKVPCGFKLFGPLAGTTCKRPVCALHVEFKDKVPMCSAHVRWTASRGTLQ